MAVLNPVGLRVFALPIRPDVLVALLVTSVTLLSLLPFMPWLHRIGEISVRMALHAESVVDCAQTLYIPDSPIAVSFHVRTAAIGRVLLAVCGLFALSLLLAAVPPYTPATPQRIHITHLAQFARAPSNESLREEFVVSSMDERRYGLVVAFRSAALTSPHMT